MRTFAFTIIFSICLLSSNVNGDLVTNFTLNGDAAGAASTVGATFSIVESSAIGNSSGTITYLVSDLDIAGDGTANDTSTLVFNFAQAGGTSINTGGTNVGSLGVSGNGAGTVNAGSETFTFGFTSGTATLGDGGSVTTSFLGFNRVRFDQLNSATESAVLSGTDMDGSVTGTTVFGTTSAFAVGGVDGSTFRVRDFRARMNYSVSPVPEPSSFGMLALATGFLVRRHRRS